MELFTTARHSVNSLLSFNKCSVQTLIEITLEILLSIFSQYNIHEEKSTITQMFHLHTNLNQSE